MMDWKMNRMNGKKNFPKRGDIYWVNLDPAVGSEIKKKRPSLIISNDVGNEMSELVIIAPMTSNTDRVYAFEVKVNVKGKIGKVMPHQCRAIDKSRLLDKLGSLKEDDMKLVDDAIKIVFGLS